MLQVRVWILECCTRAVTCTLVLSLSGTICFNTMLPHVTCLPGHVCLFVWRGALQIIEIVLDLRTCQSIRGRRSLDRLGGMAARQRNT